MVRPRDVHEPAGTRDRSPEGGSPSGPDRGGRGGAPPERLRAVWVALPRERRLAVLAAFGLVLTLFLPWYQETVIAQSTTAKLNTLSASLTGWGAFSFVEAAVLLVAAAVIVLVFVRAEGAAFHVPGGDGGVVTAAGAWTGLLIVWRMFDKEGTTAHGLYETASGIEWGIFIALAAAALLTYAGSRMKLANEPEPPLPGDKTTPEPRSVASALEPRSAPGALDPRSAAGAPDPRSPAGPPPRRRVRPSSLAEPPAARDQRPAEPTPADDRTEVRVEASGPERRPRAQEDPPHRRPDFAELEQITFDDPPEAPTVRRRRRDPSPDDPLTTRLNRTD